MDFLGVTERFIELDRERRGSFERFLLSPSGFDEPPPDGTWHEQTVHRIRTRDPSPYLTVPRQCFQPTGQSPADLKVYTTALATAQRNKQTDSPLRTIEELEQEIARLKKWKSAIPKKDSPLIEFCGKRLYQFYQIKLLYALIYQLESLQKTLSTQSRFTFHETFHDGQLAETIQRHCEHNGHPELYKQSLKNPHILVTGSPSIVDEIIQTSESEIATLEDGDRCFSIDLICSLIGLANAETPYQIEEILRVFGITSQEKKVAVAIKLAYNPRFKLHLYIESLGIESDEDRSEILRALLKVNRIIPFWRNLELFRIQNQRQLLSLVLTAITHDPLPTLKIAFNPFNDKSVWERVNLYAAAFYLLRNNLNDNTRASLMTLCPNQSLDTSRLPQEIQTLLTATPNQSRIFNLEDSRLFRRLLVNLVFYSHTTTKLARLNDPLQKLLESVLTMDTEFGITIAFVLGELLDHPSGPSYFSTLVTNQKGEILTYLLSPLVFIAKWCTELGRNVDGEIIQSQLQKYRRELRDYKLLFREPLFQALQALETTPLSPSTKLNLIRTALAFPSKKDQTLAFRIYTILAEQKALHPLPLEEPFTIETLLKWLSSITPVDLFYFNPTPRHFFESYQPLRDRLRVPLALEIYSSKISLLANKELNQAMRTLVRSLLNHKFHDVRYDTVHNKHLQELNPALLRRWRETANTVYEDNPIPNTKAIVSDQFEDLFLAGTETFSCQNVDRNPEHNKGLLGFVLDGKYQICAITDPTTGRILSRCYIRLLFQKSPDNSYKPALYKELDYPKDLPLDHVTLLEKMAYARAAELGLPSYIKTERFDSDTLISLGSNVPFETVDGFGGIAPGSGYSFKATFSSVV